MHPTLRTVLAGAAMVALATACTASDTDAAGQAPAAPVPPTATAQDTVASAAGAPPAQASDAFAEPAPGIAVRPVASTTVHRDFKRSYLAMDAWTLYPAEGSTGRPLVALVLDGSNEITSAEMRIGRSDSAADVKACTTLPPDAAGIADTADVDGVRTTHFSSSDAAMSHYLSADSYRVVQGGACYAIDLIIAGTRPEVYDPPRTPPFTAEQAKAALASMLAAVHWTH
jgi:hypothetical protein